LERVTAYVERDPDVADNDTFWKDERESFKQTFLGRLLRVVQALVGMATDDVEAQVGGGVDWGGVNEDALAWARQHAGELITGITETTRSNVREAVAAWIETGEELDALTDALTPTFGPKRAEMIASTEVTRAYDEANDLARQRVGLPATEFRAPAHTRCRCSTHPRLLDNGDWVIVWYTARDERVCKRPVGTPWGRVNGCRDLHEMVVGGLKKYQGKRLSAL
jgi:hypothetical protein